MVNKLVIENLKFRPVRSFLSVAAIALEVVMILTIVGLSRGTLAESQRRQRGIGADIIIRPRGSSALSFSAAPIPEAMSGWIENNVPHVTHAAGMIIQPLEGISTMAGVDLQNFEKLSGPFRFRAGRAFRGGDEVIVDSYYAKQNNLAPGSKVKLMNRQWTVSGVIEEGKLSRVIGPMKVIQDLTGNTGKISQIYVKVDKPENVAATIRFLKGKLEGYPIYSMEEFISLFSVNNTPGLKAFIGVVIGLSVIIGFLVVFLSMYTAVLERTREVGILKALGASPAFIVGVLLRETAILALVGSVAGVILSYGTRWLIVTLVPASLGSEVAPDWWPISAGIALAGALLGAAYPGLRAARQDPIEALSYE